MHDVIKETFRIDLRMIYMSGWKRKKKNMKKNLNS
nr:MAG TPA: hypothetical protein [Bacteriophage sp.]